MFVNATTLLYRVHLAASFSGVVLIHMVGALVYAVWTMTAVFRSIPESLEEAAWNLGASRLKTFFTVALPLATPGLVASTLLMLPGLVLLERYLESEYLSMFGRI